MNIKFKKQSRVDVPLELQNNGVVAFQVVDFTIDYFKTKIYCSHDTRIMSDGRQYVIGGDGFIPADFEVIDDKPERRVQLELRNECEQRIKEGYKFDSTRRVMSRGNRNIAVMLSPPKTNDEITII